LPPKDARHVTDEKNNRRWNEPEVIEISKCFDKFIELNTLKSKIQTHDTDNDADPKAR
jgi:hypothetical protein